VTPRTLTLPAALARAGEVAALVEGAVAAWDIGAKRAHALHLCAEEIFANICLHGGGEVTLSLTGDATAQTLVFTDTGPPFDPTTVRPPPPATHLADIAIGGRGLLLVRGFSDGMDYRHEGGRNRLELRFGPDKSAPR
jgi:serine/threonine-protein kinase RsbW